MISSVLPGIGYVGHVTLPGNIVHRHLHSIIHTELHGLV